MTEANNCCGTTCDKAALLKETEGRESIIRAQQQRISDLLREREEALAYGERLRGAIKYSSDYLCDNKLNSICSGSKAHMELISALSGQPPAALAALKAEWQADNADFVRLALELCDAVENNDNLPTVKFALRCGRLVNSIRQRAQEASQPCTYPDCRCPLELPHKDSPCAIGRRKEAGDAKTDQ